MDEIKIEDLQRIRLERGDVLLMKLKVRTPDAVIRRLKDKLEIIFPVNEILVINEDEIELSIVEQGAKS